MTTMQEDGGGVDQIKKIRWGGGNVLNIRYADVDEDA